MYSGICIFIWLFEDIQMAICVLIPTYCRLADKGRKENSEKLERRRGNPNVAEHCCNEKKKGRKSNDSKGKVWVWVWGGHSRWSAVLSYLIDIICLSYLIDNPFIRPVSSSMLCVCGTLFFYLHLSWTFLLHFIRQRTPSFLWWPQIFTCSIQIIIKSWFGASKYQRVFDCNSGLCWHWGLWKPWVVELLSTFTALVLSQTWDSDTRQGGRWSAVLCLSLLMRCCVLLCVCYLCELWGVVFDSFCQMLCCVLYLSPFKVLCCVFAILRLLRPECRSAQIHKCLPLPKYQIASSPTKHDTIGNWHEMKQTIEAMMTRLTKRRSSRFHSAAQGVTEVEEGRGGRRCYWEESSTSSAIQSEQIQIHTYVYRYKYTQTY